LSPHTVVELVQSILSGTEGLYMSDISSGDLERALDTPLVRAGDPEINEAIRVELADRAI
jgi:hypothetical protein